MIPQLLVNKYGLLCARWFLDLGERVTGTCSAVGEFGVAPESEPLKFRRLTGHPYHTSAPNLCPLMPLYFFHRRAAKYSSPCRVPPARSALRVQG